MNASLNSLTQPIREAGRVPGGEPKRSLHRRTPSPRPSPRWGEGESFAESSLPRLPPSCLREGPGEGGAVASVPGFWRGRRGSLAVETALSVSLLVIALAGIMEIVHSVYVEDRMGRASRAAARAIALVPEAGESALANRACAAIRRELDLGDRFDCATKFAVTVDRNLAPASLLQDAESGPADEAGELVVVRIAWSAGPWNPGELVADDDEGARPVAVGIARLEPETGS